MATDVQRRLFSVTEYHKMGEAGILPEKGVELINGEIVEMSPIGSKHAKIVKKLNKILGVLLGDEAIISIQDPIIANDLSEPEPDVAVLKFRSDFYENELPHGTDVLLLIEVSDTTLAYDRDIKLPLYATSGIPECWLLDLQKKQIKAFWQPEGNTYNCQELVLLDGVIASKSIKLELALTEVFK
ncbi:Uma2 family endonuclease [Haliscomenobacter sp.]|uniref:Uma2 family endonuclease n=1 Tax=Haliscomenobacter sp. TaxID=2717303 RepID=UPI003365108F